MLILYNRSNGVKAATKDSKSFVERRVGSNPTSSITSINCERYVQQLYFIFKVKKKLYLGMVPRDPFDLMVEEYASGQSSHRPDVTRNASEVRILPLLFYGKLAQLVRAVD